MLGGEWLGVLQWCVEKVKHGWRRCNGVWKSVSVCWKKEIAGSLAME